MMEKEKAVGVVGAEHVLDSPEILKRYSCDMSFTPSRTPSCVVRPNSLEHVQALIKLAAEANTPLIPVSSGEPRFRGDTVPTLGGVIVDMSRMNKIRMVDRKDRVAMVEPGVRFGELQTALRKEGLRLPTPLSPRQTKSVVGSCLEREPHIIPKYHLDHSEPLLCCEVVFGAGDVFRTGEAGGPGTIEEQQQAGRRQKIPMEIQMNINRILQGSQGTLGIVTWATVRCEVLPTVQKPLLAASDSLQQLLELAHWLVRLRLGDELFILNDVNFAHLMGTKLEMVNGLKEELPQWILLFCLAGYEFLPQERMSYQEKDASEVAKNVGVPLYETLCTVSANDVLARATSPSEPYWKLRWSGACQDIPFISAFHGVPELVGVMQEEAAKRKFPLSHLGIYVQPVCQGHGQHCEFSLFYDPTSPREAEKVKELYFAASKALMDRGAFFSRPYDLLSEMVYNRDAASREALRKLKNIFDPKNILNPGKLCF
ncbi:MAG: FAD-binding oxidoreductase [Candidatus Abyssobacteria bacterium SURF_17]|uniref:FAD-binding oxidoreductase n=1 Tax=Candidatus Abyssobacteria bacterium SURF_17 TaxID=2093361 RepID=A0A419EYJ4_9BACT|nr:MAG: FAD-binding oxidoreductase [Candidatus Abyssubacteria bacterium SURF_17]